MLVAMNYCLIICYLQLYLLLSSTAYTSAIAWNCEYINIQTGWFIFSAAVGLIKRAKFVALFFCTPEKLGENLSILNKK